MQWEKRHGLHDMQVVYDRTQTAYKHTQGDARARARQRTSVCGAAQGSAPAAQGSAPATQDSAVVAHKRLQAAQGSSRAAHRQRQGQRSNNVQAAFKQGMLATQTLADEGTRLRCSWGASKDPQGREWERHHAPSTE